jgi:dTDP-4-amino-4,6-dideoxygalactose transaminase
MNARQEGNIPFVDLGAQYQSIAGEVNDAIARVLRQCDFILGKDVELLEREFADYCQASYAVGLDNGMSALELALEAYGIGPGDEVIAPANTFIATVLSISNAGAQPVLVDVDPRTYQIDPAQIEQALTYRTKAIMPVHLYGQPADMDAILGIAQRRNLIVIEDACQAHGASYKGRRVGSLGHAAAFSFYPGKNLGGYGDGGMLVTQDKKIAERVSMMRNYGQTKKYHHVVRGGNRRLDTLQAAVLRVKLKYLDQWNAARRQHAHEYNRLLSDTALTLPTAPEYVEAVWHLYVVQSPVRDALKDHLSADGISVGMHYPLPIHLQEAYKDLGYQRGDFPISEQMAERVLSLPMYAELPDEAIARITLAIDGFEQQHNPIQRQDVLELVL